MTHDETWLLREKYDGGKTEGFFADCNRLELGEPLAYLIGSVPFLNTTIYLDSHPLIPRTETEYWVEKIIIHLQTLTNTSIRVLDLCAGSGCIGVAVLKAIPSTIVNFVEIDDSHHSTIRKNIEKNGINPIRTHLCGGSLFEKVRGTYDCILANPPYIDITLNRVDADVVAYEPALALYGGKDGVAFLTDIIAQASTFLTPTGILVLEHEPEHVAYIHTIATQHGFVTTTFPDQYEKSRYTLFSRVVPQSMPQ